MGYPVTGYVVMEDLSVVVALVHKHWGDETLPIILHEDGRYTPERCLFTSLGHPHPVAHEELIGACNLPPVSIWIKYDIISIPHLVWERLDVL